MPKTITENNLLNHYVQDTHILNSHNRLIAEEITRELKTKIVGSNVITLERTTSTMDTTKKLAHTSFKNGTVIFAEEQTKGRGRSDHSWSRSEEHTPELQSQFHIVCCLLLDK